ncbi:hypothetical protein [Streptomyces silvisoli]|uniref:Copper chaperone PCu(A)C n=1 Tax=Streptomyces silvisoli TaxID=3034235 RepID=A0ABT5ZNX3_9ACTN|nr:hypothetical protein [Streptomyces silvisoli]MDF3291530.1 hypothetical protein [Streptomyces silvisoli]
MTESGTLPRAGRASVAALLVILTAGACSHAPTDSTNTPTSASGSGDSAGIAATPGQLTIHAPGINLAISNAVAHLDNSGSGDLTMAIRNGGDVPEHLAMVAAPDGDHGTLQGSDSDASGSLSTAGILLMPHSTTTFGGSGPDVALRQVHIATGTRLLPLTLQFGVAGLVHLQARVASH